MIPTNFHTLLSLYNVAELTHQFMFDNSDMSSPKRDVLISLLYILNCFSKSLVVGNFSTYKAILMRDKKNITRVTSPLRRLISFDKRVIIMLNPVSNLIEDKQYK